MTFCRLLWTRAKPQVWWDTFREGRDDTDWNMHFSMSRATFQLIVDAVRPYIERHETNWRKVGIAGYPKYSTHFMVFVLFRTGN